MFPLRGTTAATPVWTAVGEPATDPWDMSTWADPLDTTIIRREIPHRPEKGRTIRFKFANFTEDQEAIEDFPDEKVRPFTLYHFEHYYKPRRARNVITQQRRL